MELIFEVVTYLDIGPLARVGPNHLLTDDPEYVKRILAVRSKYARGSWFDILKLDPLSPNLVSGRNKREHDHLRWQMSAGVSIAITFLM